MLFFTLSPNSVERSRRRFRHLILSMRLSYSRVEPLRGPDRGIRTTARRSVVSSLESLWWISYFGERSANYGWPVNDGFGGYARGFRSYAALGARPAQHLGETALHPQSPRITCGRKCDPEDCGFGLRRHCFSRAERRILERMLDRTYREIAQELTDRGIKTRHAAATRGTRSR
jgi:hypothetical protein